MKKSVQEGANQVKSRPGGTPEREDRKAKKMCWCIETKKQCQNENESKEIGSGQ